MEISLNLQQFYEVGTITPSPLKKKIHIKNFLIYLFLAVLGLCCYELAFSSRGERGALLRLWRVGFFC